MNEKRVYAHRFPGQKYFVHETQHSTPCLWPKYKGGREGVTKEIGYLPVSNPSMREAEVGGSLQAEGQARLYIIEDQPKLHRKTLQKASKEREKKKR